MMEAKEKMEQQGIEPRTSSMLRMRHTTRPLPLPGDFNFPVSHGGEEWEYVKNNVYNAKTSFPILRPILKIGCRRFIQNGLKLLAKRFSAISFATRCD